MQYRFLGCSGLQVSELSFGPWLTISKHLSIKKSTAIIHDAFNQGINFFDNAERYAEGMAESVLGHVFKSLPREDLVITTKLFWGGDGINRTGLSRKHLVEGTKNSLKRLQLDYVDVLFCHRPDPNTPMEEIVVTMDTLIRQSYAFYWGTSHWPRQAIIEAHSIAKKLNCIAPIVEQCTYNMFERDIVESDYLSLYQDYGMGIMVSSPLASGILTGKYSNGFAPEFRLSHEKRLLTPNFEQHLTTAQRIGELAQSLGVTSAQFALAWCLRKPYVNSVILGAANHQQLAENIGCITVQDRMTPAIITEIDAILQQSATQVT